MTKSYRIEIPRSVEKALGKLPAHIFDQIEKRISNLASNPRPPGVEKLSGEQNVYRVRQGDYRILYEIHDNILLVLIVDVGNRRDIYRRR